MKPIAIIGTGNSGLAMAGHLALCRYPVKVWGRTHSKIESFRVHNTIECNGVYSGSAKVELFTDNIAEALEDAETILITTPANAHSDIAHLVAPLIDTSTTVVLNPGRTGGLLEFTNILEQCGCSAHPTVAEAQTIIYTCRATEPNNTMRYEEQQCITIEPPGVHIVGLKQDVLLASYKRFGPKLEPAIPSLPLELNQHFTKARNLTQTSIGNVGMILHCAPTMLNSGWIECPTAKFKYYYQGISPTIAALLEKIDQERLAVASGLGTPIESLSEWLRRSYGIEGDHLLECIRNNEAYTKIEAPESLEHRYILEDVPCGLVPLESLAERLDISLPTTRLTIDLSCTLMNRDFRACGRNLQNMGIDHMANEQLRELFCS